MITSVIFEKFKEKKINVVIALRDAIDAVYLTVRLVPIHTYKLGNAEFKKTDVRIKANYSYPNLSFRARYIDVSCCLCCSCQGAILILARDGT